MDTRVMNKSLDQKHFWGFGHMAKVVFTICLMGLPWFAAVPIVHAQEDLEPDPTTHAYATYFGKGLQFWAQGDYAQAVENLSRAYAVQPNARVLRMMVRAYDFMGHCSAVEAHSTLLEEEYGVAELALLQRCRDPGVVTIRCSSALMRVVINQTILARCNRTIKLPEGLHRFEVPGYDWSEEVTLARNQRALVEVRIKPRKWNAMVAGSRRLDPHFFEHADRYTVFVSPDGGRQVWIVGSASEVDAPHLKPSRSSATRPSKLGLPGPQHLGRPSKFGPVRQGPTKFSFPP